MLAVPLKTVIPRMTMAFCHEVSNCSPTEGAIHHTFQILNRNKRQWPVSVISIMLIVRIRGWNLRLGHPFEGNAIELDISVFCAHSIFWFVRFGNSPNHLSKNPALGHIMSFATLLPYIWCLIAIISILWFTRFIASSVFLYHKWLRFYARSRFYVLSSTLCRPGRDNIP